MPIRIRISALMPVRTLIGIKTMLIYRQILRYAVISGVGAKILNSIFKFSGKSNIELGIATDLDPDRHALDPDPDPAK
jgi:hypothetical protein